MNRITTAGVIACARWEDQYLEEWLKYHIEIGFDKIFLICNDDDPSTLRNIINGMPKYTREKIFFRAYKGQGLQAQMYIDVLPLAKSVCDWICILDIDEFLVIKKYREIHHLIEYFENKSALGVYFNWLNYGPNGYETRPLGRVLQLYNRRSKFINPHTKHISHRDCFDMEKIRKSSFPFWHGLPDDQWKGYKRVNILNISYNNAFDEFPESMNKIINPISDKIIEAGYIAHFSFKSNSDAEIRLARGVGGNFSGQTHWKEMVDTGHIKRHIDMLNEIEDDYLKNI